MSKDVFAEVGSFRRLLLGAAGGKVPEDGLLRRKMHLQQEQ